MYRVLDRVNVLYTQTISSTLAHRLNVALDHELLYAVQLLLAIQSAEVECKATCKSVHKNPYFRELL